MLPVEQRYRRRFIRDAVTTHPEGIRTQVTLRQSTGRIVLHHHVAATANEVPEDFPITHQIGLRIEGTNTENHGVKIRQTLSGEVGFGQ